MDDKNKTQTYISDEIYGTILSFIPKNSIKNIILSSKLLPGVLLKYYPFRLDVGFISYLDVYNLINLDMLHLLNYNINVTKNIILYGGALGSHLNFVNDLLDIENDAPDPNFHNGIILRDIYRKLCSKRKKSYYKLGLYPTEKYIINMLVECESIDLSVNNNEILDLSILYKDDELIRILLKDEKVLKVLYNFLPQNVIRPHPFIRAVQENYVYAIELFIKNDKFDPTINNNEAILSSVRGRGYGIFELLFKDPRINLTVDIIRLYFLAAEYGNYPIFKFLFTKYPINYGLDDNKIIKLAVRGGHFDIVKMLLNESKTDPRIDPTVNNNHCLALACVEGHTEIFNLLMKCPKIDPSVLNNKIIEIAASKSNDIVKILLKDSRVNPAANYNAAIKMAFKCIKVDVVKTLIEDSRVEIQKALYCIIKTNAFNFECVIEKILTHKRVQYNNKAIHLAIKYGKYNILKTLICSEKGRKTNNPSISEPYPEFLITALDLDSSNHNCNYKHIKPHIIKLLMDNKNIIAGIQNKTLKNPFLCAMKYEDLPMAKLLWKLYPVVKNINIEDIDKLLCNRNRNRDIFHSLLIIKAHIIRKKKTTKVI